MDSEPEHIDSVSAEARGSHLVTRLARPEIPRVTVGSRSVPLLPGCVPNGGGMTETQGGGLAGRGEEG